MTLDELIADLIYIRDSVDPRFPRNDWQIRVRHLSTGFNVLPRVINVDHDAKEIVIR